MSGATLGYLHRMLICPVRGHRVPDGRRGRCIDCGKDGVEVEWMGVTVRGPAELVRDVLTVLAEHGLQEIDWCYLERSADGASADYYPTTTAERIGPQP